MANVIPMAGLGSRYSKEGYILPKPLIPVSGMPMIIRAIRDMPKSDKWIFIVRKEHIEKHSIDRLIREEIPEAIFVAVDKTTEGQACTCMLAEPHLDPEEPMFIAACDNGYLYDKKRYEKLLADPGIHSILWTFTQQETLRKKPESWGWCVLEDDNVTIQDMSVKKPISDDPYNDHAIVATFYFRRSGDFMQASRLMIKENHRINGEFYVDAIPLFMRKLGKRSIIFDVELYVGWGKPSDLYSYQKMEYVCNHDVDADLTDEETKLLPRWREYFR